MAKISYHEFRPGRWARLVDGKIVGPATPEEVKAWQRQRTDGQTIWEDVVDQIATRPELQAEHSLEPSAHTPTKRKPPEPGRIWEDVLKQAAPPKPPPEEPPEVTPRVRVQRKAEPTGLESVPQDRQIAVGGITKLGFGTEPIRLPIPGEPIRSEEPIEPEPKPEIEQARPKSRVRSKPEIKRVSPKQAATTKPKPVEKREPNTMVLEKAAEPEPDRPGGGGGVHRRAASQSASGLQRGVFGPPRVHPR